MNKLPLETESKGKPASTEAETFERPRVWVTVSDHMATTLSRPTAPYLVAASPDNFRSEQPPLVSAAPRSLEPTSSFLHPQGFPSTSFSSSNSWSHNRELQTNSQQTSIRHYDVSTDQLHRLPGNKSSIESKSVAPRGAKRQLGAQTPKRYHC